MTDTLPRWAVYNLESAVAVAPLGFRHDLESPYCWCNPKVEQVTGDHSRPMIVHRLKAHDWIRGVDEGEVVCMVCWDSIIDWDGKTPLDETSFCSGSDECEVVRE